MTQAGQPQGTQKDVFEVARIIVEALKGQDKQFQARAIRYASEELELTIPPTVSQGIPQTQPPAIPISTVSGVAVSPPADIRTFTTSKAPRTDTQFAAVVAYYHCFIAPESQRKEVIDAEDLKQAVRLVGRKQPGHHLQTLRNAKNAGYLDSADGGKFKLNSVGENLVSMTLGNIGLDSQKKPHSGKKTVAKKRAAPKKIPASKQKNATKSSVKTEKKGSR